MENCFTILEIEQNRNASLRPYRDLSQNPHANGDRCNEEETEHSFLILIRKNKYMKALN